MREPDVFDGAYGRLAATRLAAGRCLPKTEPSLASSRRPPRSRLLPRLALTPPRATTWRPPGDAAGRSFDASLR